MNNRGLGYSSCCAYDKERHERQSIQREIDRRSRTKDAVKKFQDRLEYIGTQLSVGTYTPEQAQAAVQVANIDFGIAWACK